jgi:hypothetical protein
MPTIPRRYLEAIMRLLVVAVLGVFLLVLIAAFLRIVQPRSNGTAAPTSFPDTTTTTSASTTTAGPTSTTIAPTTTTTLIPPDCTVERPQAEEGTIVLTLYYQCGGGSVPTPPDTPVYRVVPSTQLVLTATLTQLAKGPTTAERLQGFDSPFSNLTISWFDGATLAAGRTTVNFASIDFEGAVAESGGIEVFLASLHATIFQFDTIDEIEYQLGGDCDAFWVAAGEGACRVVSRVDWINQVSLWRGQR